MLVGGTSPCLAGMKRKIREHAKDKSDSDVLSPPSRSTENCAEGNDDDEFENHLKILL
jgi:hypothetical protein